MEDSFSIDIALNGKEYSFEARLIASGYFLKIHVAIDGIDVVYEPDEERNYRALISEIDKSKVNATTASLITAVGEKIDSLKQ